MEEAIASITESRQQVLVERRLRSQFESREYPADEVEIVMIPMTILMIIPLLLKPLIKKNFIPQII